MDRGKILHKQIKDLSNKRVGLKIDPFRLTSKKQNSKIKLSVKLKG